MPDGRLVEIVAQRDHGPALTQRYLVAIDDDALALAAVRTGCGPVAGSSVRVLSAVPASSLEEAGVQPGRMMPWFGSGPLLRRVIDEEKLP